MENTVDLKFGQVEVAGVASERSLRYSESQQNHVNVFRVSLEDDYDLNAQDSVQIRWKDQWWEGKVRESPTQKRFKGVFIEFSHEA